MPCESLADDVGIPRNLREVGVTDAMLESLADGAMKATIGVALNPRRPSRQDVVALYRTGPCRVSSLEQSAHALLRPGASKKVVTPLCD